MHSSLTLPSGQHRTITTSLLHAAVLLENVKDQLYVRCWAGYLYCTSYTQLQVVSKERVAVTLRVGGYAAVCNARLLIYACLKNKQTKNTTS